MSDTAAMWPLSRLRPHPDNPRGPVTDADAEMADLVASVREQGVLQALTVTPDGMIIAGHRRYHAALAAGLDEVPVVVRDASPSDQVAAMLVENLHRKALTPLQTARGCAVLIERGLTQREVARRIGKHESWVGQLLKLSLLPPSVQAEIETGQLSAAQGIALARFADKPQVLERVLGDSRRYGLSAEYIASLNPDGERLRLVRYSTSETGGQIDYHDKTRTRNRQPQTPSLSEPFDPLDFRDTPVAEIDREVREHERQLVAEYLRDQMRSMIYERPTRDVLVEMARRIENGEHALTPAR